ncbi:hypothetical protein HHK36_006300 [Tetracentron sinense]|uniref:Leucine-rich repeat-containing N-terminal plant-type domain-containing protein n=1 Tax=Tetracentron sinense TaxID=13715 RepID=A0A834ZH02_TETSI|nr:hypothetical protein HHK36_006300 [Tetracentron sinense]
MDCRLFRCFLVWVSLILVSLHGNKGCLEEERMGLLELKASVNWTKTEEGPLLHSWVDDRGSSDCCVWERVVCNPSTGRVIQLSLDDIRESYIDYFKSHSIYYIQQSIWFLNVSLFNPFEELQHLNLSMNSFDGWQLNEGFERLSKLKRLEVLILDGNHFNSTILPSLGALTSLKNVSLFSNRLDGPFSSQAKLSNLKGLNLSANRLNGSLPAQELANLINLEILYLNGNELIGTSSIGVLSSLKALYLDTNKFNGALVLHGLCELKNLQELDLRLNNISGIIPQCLSNLTSLRMLDLSKNQLSGNISSSLISCLTSLEYIDLSYNRFEGKFLFNEAFANHSMLKRVILQNGDNKLEVETEYPSWAPRFQLKVLVLSNCNLNKRTSVIPTFLSNQYDLSAVDLSYNTLNGRFPTWLVENNTRLEYLSLGKNSLKGHFQLPRHRYIYIYWIDLSNNYFDGELQENIGGILPNLEYLNLSRNALKGDIPSSIGDMRKLISLDLSNNNFSGEIPEHLAVACTSLQLLRLSSNRLSGQLFPAYFNLPWLLFLHLDNNQFMGNILDGLSKSSGLQTLDIGNNCISGKIPSWMGNFTSLKILIVRHNFLEGRIPKELSELYQLDFLDISQNNLSGSIPSFLNSSNLRYGHFQGNGFTGPIPKSFLNSSSLLTLDIRDNNLSGGIPSSIDALSNLRILLLKGNNLNGPISSDLCKMKNISIMDLSHNTFSGSIPPCFNNITFGRIGALKHEFMQVPMINSFLRYFNYDPKKSFLDSTFIDTLPFMYELDEQEQVEFITKSRSSFYEGDILNFMSGLDLSSNNLTGDIPYELGELNGIHALNLSRNHLAGSIPKTLSNLKNIESLDLSHNKLSGEIPSELSRLYALEVFSVAYNNLSGKTPDMKAQFGTFDNTSYEGNAFLCGPPLQNNCSPTVESLHKSITFSIEGNDNILDIDFVAFSSSFVGSYIVLLLGFATILFINPYCRHMWFNIIDTGIHSCFHFVADTIDKLSTCVYN